MEQNSQDEVREATAQHEETMAVQTAPVNVHEASEAIVVVAPLPAVQPDDVTIELHPGSPTSLRFWAHLRSAGPREYLMKEWDYGGYERELDLPEGFGSGMEASLANGQLAIRVLRGEPEGPLSIHPAG